MDHVGICFLIIFVETSLVLTLSCASKPRA